MHLTRSDLDDAVARGVLPAEQADALWHHLAARTGDATRAAADAHEAPRFKAAHILYYAGGLVAIGAMTLFMTIGWERFGGGGLLAISLAYAAAAALLTEALLRRALPLPAGLTGALAVVMTPLAVYGAQHVMGLWSEAADAQSYRDFHRYIDWRWILMELATLAAGAVALWRWRLPFLVMPVAVTLWYMSMDLVPLLLQGEDASFFSREGRMISTAFGLCMTLFAFLVDLRVRGPRDFAFWLYLFGVMAFWGGLSSLDSGSELGKFLYLLVNVAMVAAGAALSRRVFAVFGALGIAGYLGHLSYTVFKDSLMFPVALTALGLGIVALGVWWQRHEAALGRALRGHLPGPVRELVERRQAA